MLIQRYRLRSVAFLFASVLAGAVLPSRAGIVVYDTFGPGDSYLGGGWSILGAGVSFGPQSVAASFTPGVSGNLEAVTLATFHSFGTDSMLVQVIEDSGGLPNGSILESFSAPLSGGVHLLNSVGNPLLSAGTTYWVAVLPGASDSNGAWNLNNQGLTGPLAFESGSGWIGDGGALPAFRVEVTEVPELEGTACMAALGLLGFGFWRRGRR